MVSAWITVIYFYADGGITEVGCRAKVCAVRAFLGEYERSGNGMVVWFNLPFLIY